VHSLTSALDGGEGSISRPGRFTPQGKNPWYPLGRKLGGPRSRSGLSILKCIMHLQLIRTYEI
jgi:hypothetical protein